MSLYNICCSVNGSETYNLPSIRVFAGETETLIFNLLTETGAHFDTLDTCEAFFTVTQYHNKSGDAVVNKTIEITYDEDGHDNVVIVNFNIEDTKGLRGKYIYQLAIKSANDDYDVVGQGFLYINRNIAL